MINAWWLLIICPICAFLGWIGHALIITSQLADAQMKKEIDKQL